VKCSRESRSSLRRRELYFFSLEKYVSADGEEDYAVL
jgi:hypothetical protein